MENRFDHHDSVQCAFERTAVLMGKAATPLPRTEAEEKLKALAANDAYGVRQVVNDVIRDAHNRGLFWRRPRRHDRQSKSGRSGLGS